MHCCVADGVCLATWGVVPGYHVNGGVAANPPQGTPPACQAACIANASCTGIDFDTVSSTCYILAATVMLSKPSPGVNHYRIARNCCKSEFDQVVTRRT